MWGSPNYDVFPFYTRRGFLHEGFFKKNKSIDKAMHMVAPGIVDV